MPFILGQPNKEGLHLLKATVIGRPFNVLTETKHLEHCGCIPPGSQDERQSWFPAAALPLLIWEHLVKLGPPLWLRAHAIVLLHFS